MSMWPGTSCKICQLGPVNCTVHTWPMTMHPAIIIVYIYYFACNKLLVRWSERNWQLTKSPLRELDMWHMWKSVSCFGEDNICVQNCSINSNPDYLWYCTLYCTVATVQSVQCVQKLTSQHGDKRGCQFSYGLRRSNTSYQGHEKVGQLFTLVIYKKYCLKQK